MGVLSDITASSTGNCAVASTCLFKTNKRKQLNKITTETLKVRRKKKKLVYYKKPIITLFLGVLLDTLVDSLENACRGPLFEDPLVQTVSVTSS